MRNYETPKQIEISSIYDCLPKETVDMIIKYDFPKLKECHFNSARIACDYDDGNDSIDYVEGYVNDTPHCFNKVGDKYFDATAELNGKDISLINYQLVREYDFEEISEIFQEHGKSFITFLEE